MIPRPFEYHAPTSVDAALALLANYGGEAKLLAGGHSLLPMMKLRFAEPAHLIDLGRISTLKGIRLEGHEIRIGAMTSENDLIWSPLLAEHCPLLIETAAPHLRPAGALSRRPSVATSHTAIRQRSSGRDVMPRCLVRAQGAALASASSLPTVTSSALIRPPSSPMKSSPRFAFPYPRKTAAGATPS